MPFNLIAKPQRIHPAYNPMQVWVRDTDSPEPGFNFIFDYYVKAPFSPVFELANRFKTTRNPNHPTQGIYSTFVDLAKHSQNYLSHNIDFGLANWRFADDKQIIQYKVECKTLTPVNFIFGPYVFDNNPYTNISIFGHTFNVGDSIFIESNSSVMNGYFTVIGVVGAIITIDIYFDAIDANEPIVGNKSVFGKIYYSDKRAIISPVKETVTGYTHNQAVSFQSYPTYDSERFTLDPNPADPDFQRILTNVPRVNFTIKPYQNLYWNFLHNRGEGVNCIFFENDGGDLFKMDAKSLDNGDYMIKQVNVSPDANFVPASSGTTFPLVKPTTKYYDVWAESSCCIGYCETLDITLIIEGVETLITATKTGDIYNGKPVYEYMFSETQFIIRYSQQVINAWEMLVTQPEEIVFAILKGCYCFIFSVCKTVDDVKECESFELLAGDFDYGNGNSYQFVFEDNIYLIYYSSDDNKWYLRNDSLDIIIYEAPCTSNEYVLDYVGENYFNEIEICDPFCPPNLTEFTPYLQCDSFILNIELGGMVQVPVVRVGNTLQYPIFEGILDNFKYTLYYDMPNDRWVIRKESLIFAYDEIIFENYDFSECPITIDNDNWVPTAELCYNCINDGVKITIVFEGETYEYCVPVVGEYNGEALYELFVQDEFFIRIRYQDAVPGIGGQPGWYMLIENYLDFQGDNGYYIVSEPDCPFTNEWLIDEEFWTPDVNIVTSSCVECSASVTQFQDVITQFNSEFPCEVDCPEGVWNYLLPGDVYILSQSTCAGEQTRTSEKIRVNIQNCSGDKNNIQILFQDRAGSWSSFAFPFNVNQKVDNEKKSYRKPIGDVNLTKGYNYDTYENERPTYQVDTLKSFTLRTDWLNDEMNLYFEELLSSPVMYINFGDYKKENLIETTPEYWYACEITNPSQETIRLKNKRMFNRTIEVKLSSNDSINI